MLIGICHSLYMRNNLNDLACNNASYIQYAYVPFNLSATISQHMTTQQSMPINNGYEYASHLASRYEPLCLASNTFHVQTYDRLASVTREHFRMELMGRAGTYRKPYPDEFDLVPCPYVPCFVKFTRKDCRTAIEHMGQFLVCIVVKLTLMIF